MKIQVTNKKNPNYALQPANKKSNIHSNNSAIYE